MDATFTIVLFNGDRWSKSWLLLAIVLSIHFHYYRIIGLLLEHSCVCESSKVDHVILCMRFERFIMS